MAKQFEHREVEWDYFRLTNSGDYKFVKGSSQDCKAENGAVATVYYKGNKVGTILGQLVGTRSILTGKIHQKRVISTKFEFLKDYKDTDSAFHTLEKDMTKYQDEIIENIYIHDKED